MTARPEQGHGGSVERDEEGHIALTSHYGKQKAVVSIDHKGRVFVHGTMTNARGQIEEDDVILCEAVDARDYLRKLSNLCLAWLKEDQADDYAALEAAHAVAVGQLEAIRALNTLQPDEMDTDYASLARDVLAILDRTP